MEELLKAKQICSSLHTTQHVRRQLPEVIKLMATSYMPVKRMSHSAFIRHAHKAPTEALLAVNTLLQDSRNPSPAVRCLVLNTIITTSSVEANQDKSSQECRLTDSSLGIWQRIAQDAINDPDPMVRRFAVIAAEKLYCDDIVSLLQKCLTDPDPLVSLYSLDLYKKHGGEVSERIVFHLINNIDKYTDNGRLEILQTILHYTPATDDQMFDIMSILDGYLDSDNVLITMAALNIFLVYSHKVDDEVKTDIYNRLVSASAAQLRSSQPDTTYSMLMWLSKNVEKEGPNATNRLKPSPFDSGTHETKTFTSDNDKKFSIHLYARYLHLFLPNETRDWYVNLMMLEILQHMISSENCVAVLQACTVAAKSQKQCLRHLLNLLLKLKDESPDPVHDCFASLIEENNPEVCKFLIEFLPSLLPYNHSLAPKLCHVLSPVWQQLSELGLQNLIMVCSECPRSEQWIISTLSEITSLLCSSQKATVESRCLLIQCVYVQFVQSPDTYAPFLKKILRTFHGTKDVRLGKQIKRICSQISLIEIQPS